LGLRAQRLTQLYELQMTEWERGFVLKDELKAQGRAKSPDPDPPELRSPEDHTVRIVAGDGKDLPLFDQPRPQSNPNRATPPAGRG
jgi:hypothetical protein